MASQEEQLRLVAEVVDKFSPQLKQMLKSFQQISAAGKEVHEKGTKQTNEHAKAYKELGERVDRFRKFGVEALTPALGALGLAGFGVRLASHAVSSTHRCSSEVFGPCGGMP